MYLFNICIMSSICIHIHYKQQIENLIRMGFGIESN